MTNGGRYRHRCVADLAWAVSSPPLLRIHGGDCSWYGTDWYQDQYRYIEGRLDALDRDPAQLESLLVAQKDQRLGNYFETLWAFALQLSPRYHLVERNLQIIDGQRTLGEMDFIVFDAETGRYAHWELAVKFYLGVGATVEHGAWHGPRKKDRLDLKIDHLLNRQTLLSSHPAAQAVLNARGIDIEDRAVILKGRLFYPWRRSGPEHYPLYADPSHLTGRWLTRRQLLHYYGAHARCIPLVRNGWMANDPMGRDSHYSVSVLLQLVNSGRWRLPLQVGMLGGASEPEKLFIVDDEWPDG